MNNIKGYKVVNYNAWESIPDIFTRIKDAKEAKKNWKFKDGAVIDYFNSKNKTSKIMVENNA